MGNPVLRTIRSRRSVRSYPPGQVSLEELHPVLEAGQFAPSGGNHQLNSECPVPTEAQITHSKRICRHRDQGNYLFQHEAFYFPVQKGEL